MFLLLFNERKKENEKQKEGIKFLKKKKMENEMRKKNPKRK